MENSATVKPLADINITDRELRHLAAAWLSCSGKENIDFDMFTILTGHPNSANARKRFGEIKKRVRDQVFGAGGVDPASVSSTPRKRKTKRDDDSASPTKKSKVTKVEDEDPGVLEDALKTEQVDE